MALRLVHSSDETDVPSEPETAATDGAHPRGYKVLTHRYLPGSRMRADHILIGPSGVYAIVRKRIRGKIELAQGRLTVNGLAREAIADHVRHFAAGLQRIVLLEFGDIGIPVTPVVCIEGAEPPKLAAVDGVRLVSSRGLGRWLRCAPAALSGRDVDILTRTLRTRLLPA